MPRTVHVVDDDDLARDVISSLVATLPGVGVDSTAMQVRTAIEANDIASATLNLRSSD